MKTVLYDNRLINIDFAKIRRTLTIFLFIIISITSIFSLTLYAADGDNGSTEETQEDTSSSDTYAAGLTYIESNSGKKAWAAKPAYMIESAVKIGALDIVASSGLFDSKGAGSKLIAPFRSGYTLFKNVGIGLAVMWALVSIVSNMQIDHVTWDIIIKFALKMMAAVYIVNNGTVILDALLNLGDSAVKAFNDGGTTWRTEENTYMGIATRVAKEGLTGNMITIISNLLPFCVVCVAIILIFSKLISRMIELGIRYMFAPIAIADVFSHGGGSTGARYLKKFGAVSLSGAVYLAIIYILPTVSSTLSAAAGGGTFFQMLMPALAYVAGIGILNRVDSIVNDFA